MVSPSIVELNANIISLVPPFPILSTKLDIFKSLGPIPSKGDIFPPKTCYNPLYELVFSIAITSLISSTTQITELSLLVFEQISHNSLSHIL